jgi:DedD protein
MDLALKQRLVGASVLIALAVIFLPLLFDGSTQESNQSITIEIPQEPQELTQKVLSIDGNSSKVDEEIKKEVLADRPTIKKQETIVEVVDNSEPTKPIVIEKEELKQEVKIAPKITKIKPKEKPKNNPTPTINTSTDNKEVSYRIKLGVFSEVKNAQKIKAKLIHNGIDAIVEKDAATGMYKVYSKQYINLARTKELNKKIQNLKLKLGKTSIETLNDSASDDAQMLLDTGWIVQIGLFSSQQNSIKLRNKIRKKGFVSFVDSINTSTNKKMYRVRVGPFATRDEALSEQKKVKKSMNLKGIVKPHEKQKVVL